MVAQALITRDQRCGFTTLGNGCSAATSAYGERCVAAILPRFSLPTFIFREKTVPTFSTGTSQLLPLSSPSRRFG